MKIPAKSSRGLFLSCLLAQAVWLIASVILLLIFCAIAYSMEDPESVSTPLSLCALYISAVICGVAAVKLSNDGVMSGVISGAIAALIIFVLSVLPLPDSSFTFPQSILFTLLIIPASVAGSFVGKKRAKKPRSISKRKHR